MIANCRFQAARNATARLGMSLLVVFVAAGAANAQQLSEAFGGFATSPDQPIDIQANRLDVDDNTKRAVFTGDVVAIQDTFTINASRLEVHYAARAGAKKKTAAASGFGGGSTEITRLVARGQVFIKSARDNPQTATGNWAEFDVQKRIITMGDLVTLKQGKNVIRGTRVVINLNTGKSSVLSNQPGSGKKKGRIRMVITPDKALRKSTGQRGKKSQRRKSSTRSSRPVRSTRTNQ